MVTVVNMRDPAVKVAIRNRDKRYLYCGRGSRWHGLLTSLFANPFPITETEGYVTDGALEDHLMLASEITFPKVDVEVSDE